MVIDQLTITLALPPRVLSPNVRSHWAVKARAVRAYRTYAMAMTRAAMDGEPGFERASAQATFYWRDSRIRDFANAEASLKAAYDGIVDAGILPDDNSQRLSHEPTVFAVDKVRPRVEIRLRRVE